MEIMKNPLYTKSQIVEYIIVGLVAAIGYSIFLWAHLMRASYESSYLLYIGNAVFGAVILVYNLILIRRSYVSKRTVSMLIEGHLAAAAGTILSIIIAVIATLAFHPDIVSPDQAGTALYHAPANTQRDHPAGWLFMVVIDAFLLNFSTGSFVSIITSYAGKRNQTKDRPAHLGTRTGNGPVTNDAS